MWILIVTSNGGAHDILRCQVPRAALDSKSQGDLSWNAHGGLRCLNIMETWVELLMVAWDVESNGSLSRITHVMLRWWTSW